MGGGRRLTYGACGVERTMGSMLSTAERPKPPAPECALKDVGPCAVCQHPTQRYGYGGGPLCVLCRATVEAARAK